MAEEADLARRLEEAESTLDALRDGEIDAIIGRNDLMMVCLRDVEVALRASQARYQTLLESIDQGFCVVEMLFDDTGKAVDYRFLETNGSFEAHTGIRDAVGRSMREVAPDHEEIWFERYGEVALTGKPVRFESAAKALGRVYDVYAFRIDEPALRRVALLFKDITGAARAAERRRQSELALRASEERFRRLADAMPQLVWTATSDGTVDYYNSQVARYSGIQPTPDRTAWTWPPVLHPDDLDRTHRVWNHATATGEVYECEHRVRMSDGTFRWHLSRAYRVGPPEAQQWFGTATDIDDLKITQERLRESEQRFKTMANTAPAMLWISDERNQRTFLSRGWYEYTGQAPADGLGWGWLDAVHPDDRERTLNTFLAAAARHEPFTLEQRLRTAAGEHRWTIDAARPRFDDTGAFMGFIGSVFDVHERKQAEEALREADRRKDDFLAVLAHELRNPLAPLRNGLEVLRLAGADSDASLKARAMMERQVDQMVRLIDDLLDTSRIARGKFELRRERKNFVEIVRNALETSRPLLVSAGHRLQVHLPDSALAVDADPVRIAQVLTNLLNNAAHYTSPGGSVTLTVRGAGDEVVADVADDGVGIPEHMLERIFEPFLQLGAFSGRARHDGLGLGLALARSIVQLHGGSIHASRGAGGCGSVFTVRIPLATGESTAAADNGRYDAGESARRLQVLVVDDNRDAAESLGTLLALMGHEVRIVNDGAQALEAVVTNAPDVMFLDIGMPGMDGYEVARRLRQRPASSAIRIVALSGYGQDADKRRSALSGFDAHVVKPVDLPTLEAVLASSGADSAVGGNLAATPDGCSV